MSVDDVKWFCVGIGIACLFYIISIIYTYIFGRKTGNSYEPFWLKIIVIIWAIFVGINDRK